MNPTDFQQSLVSTSLNSLRQNNTHINNVISAQQTSSYVYQSPVQTTPSTYSGQGNTNYNIASTHQNVNFSNQYDPMSIQQTFQTSIQTNSLTDSQNPPVHLSKFFYQPPNDTFNYHIECEKISDEHVIQLLNQPFSIMQLKENDYLNVFFYKQRCNNQFYQVSCKIVSPSFLNKNFYGTETGQNISQEKLAFTLYQKEILKQDLASYLSYHLLD
ncbi:unnamed protein product [Rhizophagus irregularis]|uniref:Uncharacterized protein n=1 Tax=Rhizophagus irregularis TaxID=588596 RepID=A0A2N1NZY5_9GLOM|nr:hypothetical protein RhiirC2_842599 [Rhizophagus irregularis]CAB4387081.1 unnamed protein product [Rhizophagus irregularis]CAB5386007.1 unnamed protein product [Rhizophagus irregularis]